MFEFNKKRCKRCLLQEDEENFIFIYDDGLCNICKMEQSSKTLSWDTKKRIFEERIEKIRGKQKYDGLVMLSGGKDSAYIAYVLRKIYNLNILGVTVDIGFEYDETLLNAKNIANKVDIPFILYKPEIGMMRRFFRFLFVDETVVQKNYSHVCLYCGRYLKYAASLFAKQYNIPVIFSGHNPEQVTGMGEGLETEIDEKKIRTCKKVQEKIREDVIKTRKRIEDIGEHDLLETVPEKDIPDGLEFIYLFQYFAYRPVEMIKTIKKELGWEPMKHFSKNYLVSACKLSKLWTYLAYKNKTTNYVDLEFSSQIRKGMVSKEVVEQFYKEVQIDENELKEITRDLGLEDDFFLK